MDNLSKLGFLAAEHIFNACTDLQSAPDCTPITSRREPVEPREDIAVICFNRSASLDIDTQYQKTIQDNDNYFPSPSLFVYTLPNIAAGEIAIRNKFLGETSFYVTEEFDAGQMVETVENAFSDTSINAVLLAWIECFERKVEVFMCLVDRNSKKSCIFTEENLKYLAINIKFA
ncbi:MAG: hypothetical protein LBK94_02010 [Prevotellaceae bacterium]|jgi:3-oxoacyl-[acyl-carrier-protein] synthase-1|nr:hypothetical protein [Prevotellaceae bacterium]